MARRGAMDHAGSGPCAPWRARRKCSRRRENTKRGGCIVVGFAGSRANMRLGCKAVAHAVGRDGVYYWTMVIGP